MDNKSLRLVFFGTPDFAAHALEKLVEEQYNIVGVVTATDKPAGRGNKLRASAVKEMALKHGLPLLQPPNLKAPDFLADLKTWQADLQIVVAFRMLPETVWSAPPMGTFNLHASLLPQYRGAAPINWAIMNGETESGVTTFFLQHEIDTGAILLQQKTTIAPNETVGQLHDKLMLMGADLILKTVDSIAEGQTNGTDQSAYLEESGPLKSAPKLFKPDCRINWNSAGKSIHDHVRGLNPFPTATTLLTYPDGTEVPLKVYEVVAEKENADALPGTVQTDGKTYLKVACADGYISLLQLQQAGKKRMGISDFLRGFDTADSLTAH